MPPPSSGGITVASALGILENFNLGLYAPTAVGPEGGRPSVFGVHLVAEAERLAYADRDKYVADADFVPLPGGSPAAMLDKDYLRGRAGLIGFARSMGTAQPGDLGAVKPLGVAQTPEAGTTHVSLVDRYGNVVVMTTTIESAFGSYRMTRGFLLNNQLTDFSAAPADAAGNPIANAVAPNKRPRSSMAPTLVFRTKADGTRGEFVMATGSPGGSTIIQYVVKTLVGTLDWGLDAQQAMSLVDFGAANSAVDQRRRRASERRRDHRRGERPARDGAARPRPHGIGGGAVERAGQHREDDGGRGAGLRRRRRSAARGHRARRRLRALTRRRARVPPRAARRRPPAGRSSPRRGRPRTSTASRARTLPVPSQRTAVPMRASRLFRFLSLVLALCALPAAQAAPAVADRPTVVRLCAAVFSAAADQLACISGAHLPEGVAACAVGFSSNADKLRCIAGARSRDLVRACTGAFSSGGEQTECIARAHLPEGVWACAMAFSSPAEKLACVAGARSRGLVLACMAAFTVRGEQLQCISDAKSPEGVAACAATHTDGAAKLTCAAGAPSREVVRACGAVYSSTGDKLACTSHAQSQAEVLACVNQFSATADKLACLRH